MLHLAVLVFCDAQRNVAKSQLTPVISRDSRAPLEGPVEKCKGILDTFQLGSNSSQRGDNATFWMEAWTQCEIDARKLGCFKNARAKEGG